MQLNKNYYLIRCQFIEGIFMHFHKYVRLIFNAHDRKLWENETNHNVPAVCGEGCATQAGFISHRGGSN